jgi:hypothetical protein
MKKRSRRNEIFYLRIFIEFFNSSFFVSEDLDGREGGEF